MIGAAILVVFAAMLIRTIRRPVVAVALLLMFFAGKQLVQLSLPVFAARGPLLSYVVFGILGLIWIQRASRGRAERMLGIPREYAPQLFFLALTIVSTTWSMDPYVWDHLFERLPYLIVYALVVPSLIASTRGINEAYQWIAWVGGAISIIFLIGYPESSNASRLVLAAETGTGDTLPLNPLAVGAMGAVTAVAAALADFPRRRLVYALRLVLATAGLLVAARSSRGDLFAALLVVGIFGAIPTSTGQWLQGRRMIAALATVVAASGVLYYGLFLTDYWSRYVNMTEDAGILDRQEMVAGVLNYYLDHPGTWLFGSGWSSSFAIVGFYPHNGPVQALCELGLIGAATWCSSVLYILARGLRLVFLANRTRSPSLDVVRPALGLVLCTLISNLKAGDCIDIWLCLTLATASQLLRRFRPESEKALFR